MNEQIVLIFHGLGQARADLPEAEKPYWVSPALFAEVVELVAHRRDQGVGREVVFTFDDSNASDLLAADLLAARGLAGRFFLLSERFGRDHYLLPADAKALRGRGMTIGSHGHAHLDWRTVDDAVLAQELGGARRLIEDAVDCSVTEVAIPFGSYDRRVLKALRQEGFARIYNSDNGPARRDARLVRRTCVMCSHTVADVEAILNDDVSMMQRLRRTVMPVVKQWR